ALRAALFARACGATVEMASRSPAAFARDLTALVSAARSCVGDAAVVIAGVAPLKFFPGLPSPLRGILGWRCTALQTAAERVAEQLPRLVVERFSALFVPELFASDGFPPNSRAQALWGEKIAALALPLLQERQPPCGHPAADRRPICRTLKRSSAGRHARSTKHRAPPRVGGLKGFLS